MVYKGMMGAAWTELLIGWGLKPAVAVGLRRKVFRTCIGTLVDIDGVAARGRRNASRQTENEDKAKNAEWISVAMKLCQWRRKQTGGRIAMVNCCGQRKPESWSAEHQISWMRKVCSIMEATLADEAAVRKLRVYEGMRRSMAAYLAIDPRVSIDWAVSNTSMLGGFLRDRYGDERPFAPYHSPHLLDPGAVASFADGQRLVPAAKLPHPSRVLVDPPRHEYSVHYLLIQFVLSRRFLHNPCQLLEQLPSNRYHLSMPTPAKQMPTAEIRTCVKAAQCAFAVANASSKPHIRGLPH